MLVANLFKHLTYQVFSPGAVLKEKYDAFKSLLTHDKCAHELMAELEEIYYDQKRVDFEVIESKYEAFSQCIFQIVEDLVKMRPLHDRRLEDHAKKLDSRVRSILAPPEYHSTPPFTMVVEEIPPEAHRLVGGKARNLAALQRDLRLPIPKGFVVTTNAFYHFMEYNDLWPFIHDKLCQLDLSNTASLHAISQELEDGIMSAQIPSDLKAAIQDAFRILQERNDRDLCLAVRSSAVGEDSRTSFAGQYRTVLDVKEDDILHAYKEVIASKYSPRALYYRISYGLSDRETPMAVMALEMVDAAVSGVIYTEDVACPESDCVAIHAIWGLGELLVAGEVSPDIIRVRKGEKPDIAEKKIGAKSREMVFSSSRVPEMLTVPGDRRDVLCLDDESALTLARWAMELERYFEEPQDIEWGLDKEGRLFLLQARPLNRGEVIAKPLECDFDGIENKVLVSLGDRASSGIGAGRVYRVEQESDLERVPEGAVLVSRRASPQFVTVLDRVAAVVTDLGSTAGHFSSVAREFGVPALVNTGTATDNLPEGKEVTVYADGEMVYDGIIPAMVESPCARRDLLEESPFARKLKDMMHVISPLTLVDPQAPNFHSGGVRSFHDIIRFSHEKAVQEMFHAGDRRMRRIPGSKKLVSDIPMIIYVLDVGGGLKENLAEKKTVRIDEIESRPMKAVFKGLCHPGIHWGDFSHFDWAAFDRTVMSGGIISPESAVFASYGVVSSDYLNLNLRFGYHFAILDTMCCDKAEDNYILFRFAGGGADVHGKSLRAEFLKGVLDRLEFEVETKADLVDAQLKGRGDKAVVMEKLDLLGRLLGVARLLDMYLKDSTMVEGYIEDFMNGRYSFGVSRLSAS